MTLLIATLLSEVLRFQTRPHYFSLSKHKVPGAGTFIGSIPSLGAQALRKGYKTQRG